MKLSLTKEYEKCDLGRELTYIQCMLGFWVRGSSCMNSHGMMMMILVKGVSVMCQTKIIMFDLIKSGMEVDSGRGNVY